MNTSSMDRHQIQLEQIHQALKVGTLDAQSVYNIVLAEIDKEIRKPSEEVNNEYVNTCMALLEMVGSCKAKRVPSHYDSNLKAIQSKFRPEFKWNISPLKVGVTICMACVILLAGVWVPAPTIETSYSGNEERYIVQGVEPTPILNAEAGEDTLNVMKTFSTWEEAIQAYGDVPNVPTWLPSGWEVDYYSVNLLSVYKRFTVKYVNENDTSVFTETHYYDISSLTTNIEQNEAGHFVELDSDLHVYVAYNIDLITSEWHTQDTLYTYFGPFSEADLVRSIESIERK